MIDIKQQKDFQQVCVWPLTIIRKDRSGEFEKFMSDNFGIRVQYLEEILTSQRNGLTKQVINGNDVVFSVHNDDIEKFDILRLSYGIRLLKDVLSK